MRGAAHKIDRNLENCGADGLNDPDRCETSPIVRGKKEEGESRLGVQALACVNNRSLRRKLKLELLTPLATPQSP